MTEDARRDDSASMRLSDFDFDLPPDRIALRPARPRDSARLLSVAADGALTDLRVSDLPSLLRPGDVLVFNDTRVLRARLFGRRIRGESSIPVDANLLKPEGAGAWSALMRPGKRLRPGDDLVFAHPHRAGETLQAKVLSKDADGVVQLGFDLDAARLSQAIDAVGAPPLPPYIAAQRPFDDDDDDDYQTVYARQDGSVAAPTAGLHFTAALIKQLTERGVETVFVTLHVGAGTFLPVKTEVIEDHRMHAEYGEISPLAAARLNAARARGGRVICVGTTSLRLLESAASPEGEIRPFVGETDIFIRPGYVFRAADGLMTNFHLPRSTLLMLVAAFASLTTLRQVYAHALASGYRFYSYGDASLWMRAARP